MTCYFRHLKSIFEKLDITVTKENRKNIDKAIHNIVGIDYKNCPATWKLVKKSIIEDKENFVNMLKNELAKN
jgi:hypothetical protein